MSLIHVLHTQKPLNIQGICQHSQQSTAHQAWQSPYMDTCCHRLPPLLTHTPPATSLCVPRRLPYGVSVVPLLLKLPWFIGMAHRYCSSPSTALLWHYMTSSQPVTCTLTWSQQRDHGERERSARFRLYSNIWSRLVLRACKLKNKQQSRGLSRPCYPYTIMMKCNRSMTVTISVCS